MNCEPFLYEGVFLYRSALIFKSLLFFAGKIRRLKIRLKEFWGNSGKGSKSHLITGKNIQPGCLKSCYF
jgi:hypothetical protein